MKKLEIIDLHVEVNGTEIIKGISLTFLPNKVYALMGPNGSGKSTLANALMGNPKYKITKGKIILDGEDITNLKPNERSKLGLFLSFQHPPEIPGVNIQNFLRIATNNITKKNYSVLDFHNLIKEKLSELNMDTSFIKRNLNEGFSGGEKKRLEMLQLSLLQPKYALLDETDSGLDVDAIRTVAESINKIKKKSEMAIIVISHYHKFLEYIKPDEVSIISKGKIIKQGTSELAKQIEDYGFENLIK